jgi:NAD(P)-dependent dehydrogenase (short-subunit alcohol dehydrogenase family)
MVRIEGIIVCSGSAARIDLSEAASGCYTSRPDSRISRISDGKRLGILMEKGMEPEDDASVSRCQFVGGVTAGLAAAFVPPAFGQQEQQGQQGRPRQPGDSLRGPAQSIKQDPRTQYPIPPFPPQRQEPPGLVIKMTPRPDHGETSYKGSGRLMGRKALVTGGDSGIGRAAVIAFAREGADVAINYLPVEEPDAREVVELIRAEGRRAVAIPGDIRDEVFCSRLVTNAVQELGGLDILVNNAAMQAAQPSIADLTTEQFDSIFKCNVYAMFWITRAAMRHLKPGAAIINTSSIEAYTPSADFIDYAQTKACIIAFTKALAKQVAKQGIRVNAVAPGPFWTPLQTTGWAELDRFGKETPLGRPGQPAELGPLYVLLASQESSYATGQVYGASGGEGQP